MPEFYIVVAFVAFLIGLSKGGMGAILIVLVTPILSLVMPVQQAISLSLPLLLIADVLALILYWNTWDMHYVRRMMPVATLGIVIGTVLLWLLPDLTLRRILGLITLGFVAYRLLSGRIQQMEYHPREWHAYAAGAASGLGSALANTGSPPFTAYMLLQEVSPRVFVGTATLFFAIINALKLPGLIATGLFNVQDVINTAWVLPVIPAGVFAGRWMVQRIDRAAFERLMLALLILASAILLFR
ncbi:sulfite exporter TauE/SafE family protein [Anaerolineae bacterium CFX9]|jgi:uncharacterized membrane protein YfcA|nr:sulfite exporter TauE/SafE family protein [Kamptonema cortianum]MDL1899330.1 sulfite exporter TauE/SafE family protein [Anaerolineae bacterium CFX9]